MKSLRCFEICLPDFFQGGISRYAKQTIVILIVCQHTLTDQLSKNDAYVIRSTSCICCVDKVLAGTLKVGCFIHRTDKILFRDDAPQTITTNHQRARDGKTKSKNIRIQYLSLPKSAV